MSSPPSLPSARPSFSPSGRSEAEAGGREGAAYARRPASEGLGNADRVFPGQSFSHPLSPAPYRGAERDGGINKYAEVLPAVTATAGNTRSRYSLTLTLPLPLLSLREGEVG